MKKQHSKMAYSNVVLEEGHYYYVDAFIQRGVIGGANVKFVGVLEKITTHHLLFNTLLGKVSLPIIEFQAAIDGGMVSLYETLSPLDMAERLNSYSGDHVEEIERLHEIMNQADEQQRNLLKMAAQTHEMLHGMADEMGVEPRDYAISDEGIIQMILKKWQETVARLPKSELDGKLVRVIKTIKHPQDGLIAMPGDVGEIVQSNYAGYEDYALVNWRVVINKPSFVVNIKTEVEVLP